MVYQANIPQPTDQLSDSQADILGNFQALEPIIDGIFNIPPQAGNPTPTGHNIIFSKIYGLTGLEEVFIQNAAGTRNTPITAAGLTNNGFSEFPSGLLMKWGVTSVPIVGNNPINLNLIGPAFTSVFWGGLTFTGTTPAGSTAKIVTIVPATLTVQCFNVNIDIYWIVFGIGS